MGFVYLGQVKLFLQLTRLCRQLLNLCLEKRFFLLMALNPGFTIFQLKSDFLELEVLFLRFFLDFFKLFPQLLD